MPCAQLQQGAPAGAQGPCLAPGAKPRDHQLVEQHRMMTHRLGAAGQYQIAAPAGDIQCSALQGLQPGRAVALHGPCRHPFPTTETQCDDTCDIGLIRPRRYTAEHDLIDPLSVDCESGQQCPAGCQRQVTGVKRTGPAAHLEKWRARPINHINGASPQAAGLLIQCLLAHRRPPIKRHRSPVCLPASCSTHAACHSAQSCRP